MSDQGSPEERDRNVWPRRAGLLAVVAMLVFSVVMVLTQNEEISTFSFLALLAAVVGWVFTRRYKNRTANVLTSEAVMKSGKAPVLYLRPFSQDDEIGLYYVFLPVNPLTWLYLLRPAGFFRSYWLLVTMRFSFESLLEYACRQVGPVVGIGQPGDRIPSASMVTEYVGDNWQERVGELATASQLVVLRAGLTDGLMWEVDAIAELIPPEKLLVYVGNGVQRRSSLAWWLGFVWVSKKKRARFYADFRAHSLAHFPKPLPETIGKHKFIRFNADWMPVVVSSSTRSSDPDPAERVARYMESVLL